MKGYKKIMLFLIGIILLKIAFSFLADSYPSFRLRDVFTSVLNTDNIVSLTNESRKAAGLQTLKINKKLSLAAQKKAEDMLKNQYFSHESRSGKLAWDFLDEIGYNYLFAGENLAMNFNSAEEITQGWLTSLKHKENILDKNYTNIGIGIAAGKFLDVNTTIVVQMFGKPLRSGALTVKKKMPGSKHAAKLKKEPLKEYLSRLVQTNAAQWMPSAKIHQIYALSETTIPTKQVLNILFSSIIICGTGILGWRFLRKKY